VPVVDDGVKENRFSAYGWTVAHKDEGATRTGVFATEVAGVGQPSAQEQHHIREAMTLFGEKDSDVLSRMCVNIGGNTATFSEMLKQNILATDGWAHKHLMDKLTALITAGKTLATLETGTVADRELFRVLILHQVDIGNPLRPIEVSKKWARLVLNEFLQEGVIRQKYDDWETRFTDKAMHGTIYKTAPVSVSQPGFIQFMVAPLVAEMKRLMPSFGVLETQMNTNKAAYAAIPVATVDW
jgi:hypothetical protein